MSARDELHDLLERTFDDVGIVYDAVTDAILDAGYSKPRAIESGVVYISSLPTESVIRTRQGYTMERLTEGWYRAGVIYAYTPNPNWLPATVLYEPSA